MPEHSRRSLRDRLAPHPPKPPVASTSKAKNGDEITVAFDPHKIHLFDPETELTILN